MTEGGGGGGVRQRFVSYAPKNHNFISIPQKNPLVFFNNKTIPVFYFWRLKKIPESFIDPKKSLLAKSSGPKKPLEPPPPLPVIKTCEWAPGEHMFITCTSTIEIWNRFYNWYVLYGVIWNNSIEITLNHIILIAKYHIYCNTTSNAHLFFAAFLEWLKNN